MNAFINPDFFEAGFCSCKTCILAIHGKKCKESERSGDNAHRAARRVSAANNHRAQDRSV